MARKHLEIETLERLEERALDVVELRSVAWHLYRCRRCRAQLRRTATHGDRLLAQLFAELEPVDTAVPRDYSAAFDAVGKALRSRMASVSDETEAATRCLEEILALPRGERRTAIRTSACTASWKFAELLLERCAATWSNDSEGALQLAELALSIVDRLTVTPGLKADLRARAWAYTGNCRRISGDLRPSSAAFLRAREWLEQGTGDVAEMARVLDLESSLLRARRRFTEAERCLDRASRLYTTVGDTAGVSRTLLKRATVLYLSDRAEEAVQAGRRALALIDVEKEPRLYVGAFYNVLLHMQQLGRYEEVAQQLGEARRLMQMHGGEYGMRRMRWFEGTVARDTGDPATAERLLLQVRGEFVARRSAYEAAMVSLDLVILYLEQGRREPVRRLAQEMLSVFASLEVQREAMAAFILFQRAAMAETLTASVARQVLSAVRKGQVGPAKGGEGKPS